MDLYEWKLIKNSKCTWCQEEDETMIHIFWESDTTKRCLRVFQELCAKNCININFNVCACIFNRDHDNKHHIINFVSILLKQFLYKNRCKGITPNSGVFLRELEYLYNIEMANAKLCNRWEKCQCKWSPIRKELTENDCTDPQ